MISRFTNRKTSKHTSSLPIPSDDRIQYLCKVLEKQFRDEQVKEKYAPVRHILTLIGTGALVGASLLVPGSLRAVKPFLDEKLSEEFEQWKQYNPYYLRRTLRRLQ